MTALGLLIAGTVRAEATLAIVNIAWVILAGAGGVVFPLKSFPDWYAGIVAWSPSAALGDGVARQLHSASVARRPALGTHRVDRGHWVYCLAQVQVV